MSLPPLVAPAGDLSMDEVRRYSRHLIIPDVGMGGQKRLKNARVLCVGTGGLGSPVLMYLAAAGVGTLGIVEFDVVDESNLQRQIIHGQRDVGRSKAESARESVTEINPFVQVNLHIERLDSSNAMELFAQYDLIVDGTDNFATRYLVNDACVLLGKPYVWGSIYRFDGQASVFWAEHGPCYRCLYPAGGSDVDVLLKGLLDAGVITEVDCVKGRSKVFMRNSQAQELEGRREDALLETKRMAGDNFHAVVADVATPDGRGAIADRIDGAATTVLVHNAATTGPLGPLDALTLDGFRATMASNVEGPLFLTKALMPKLARGSRVLHVSTGGAHQGFDGMLSYCASKAALRSVYESLRDEHAGRVCFGSAQPGVVATEMMRGLVRRRCGTCFHAYSGRTRQTLVAPGTGRGHGQFLCDPRLFYRARRRDACGRHRGRGATG